jgi:hypothetical protein
VQSKLIYGLSEQLPPQCKKVFKMLSLHINHKTVRSQKDRAIVLIKQMIPEKLKSVAGKMEDTGNK